MDSSSTITSHPATNDSSPELKQEPTLPLKSTSWIGPSAAIVAIAACMLNGHSILSLALLTLFTGLSLTLAPPVCRLPAFLAICTALTAASASISLLPAAWFGTLPDWRSNLTSNWGFILPDTLSPQPAFTLGGLLTLLTAGLWLFLIIGSRLTESSRRLTLRLLTLGIYLIAALALFQRFGWINLHWPLGAPNSPQDLGPFANRNHFSCLCAIGCVLGAGLAHDAFREKSRSFLLFAAGILIPFTGIVVNTSRAGLLLFFIGLTIWLTTGSVRSGFFRTLAVSASLVFGAAAVLLVFGGGSGAKLVEQGFDIQAAGGRLPIYEQTLAFASQAPIAGIGLGNFDPVFSLLHSLPSPTSRIIHPESDWLWWWIELGILGLLPITLALLWLLFHSFPSSDASKHRHHRHDRRLRGIACISLIIALLHGLVDVPLHGIGFASIALLLAACTVPPRKLQTNSPFLSRLAFRSIGLGLIALGTTHLMALTQPPKLTNRPSTLLLKQQITALTTSGKHDEALQLCDQALLHTPLDWALYFQRAYLKLQLRQPSANALTDFNRARVLEPNNLTLCQGEAELWLKFDPTLAIIPWRDLLTRTPNPWFYATMLNLSRPHPELSTQVRRLATTPAMLASILFTSPTGPSFDTSLRNLLDLDPNLNQIDLQQRTDLLTAWQQRGDRDQLLSLLESHPEWHSHSWPMLADEYARQTEFRKAWEVQKKHAYASSPQAISSGALFENLERNFALKPTDARLGVDLYFAQKKRGLLDEASRTLDRLLALPDPPAFLNIEKAALFAERQDFRRAYETMKSALASKPNNPPHNLKFRE